MKNRLFLLTFVLSLPLAIFAQDDAVVEEAAVLEEAVWGEVAALAGMVTDVSSGAALVGANVVVEGTDLGAAADANGSYLIENVPAGSYTVTASVIGYKSSSESVTIGTGTAVVNFSLATVVLQMSGLEVLASRAGENTPVAFTNVSKADMEFRLGSQDIPMALNTTPSVYATAQGGGAGDARINVRGFNQRNVAIMINGVPQNDMENGWVYWSNWDGVGDATQSIQMQRGLSAVNLAAPSIGGSMNIITDPTAMESGGLIKQELGAGGFLKTSISYNTGLINDNMAFSGTIVRKIGDGVIDKTWTDAWAYYFGASYALNSTNRFELYAIGAPQRHGQNLYKQNIGAYDHEFAKSITGYRAYDTDAIASDGKFKEAGRFFNQNWSPISSSYKGQQYWYMYGANTVDRHDPNYLNERENFFHKPLINLNHFLTINDQMRLSSILYWSGRSGGGTGTYGRIPTMDADGVTGLEDYKFYYGRSPWTRDWDALVEMNSGDADTVYVDKRVLPRTHGSGNNQSVGILRNSINRQWTIGLISKFNYNMSDEIKLEAGVDWRTAEIEHAREVRDLMGGDYYMDYADDNSPDGKKVGLGDIIAYHNTNTVDWIGFFGQGNYTKDAISAYGMFGFSTITYTHNNHFLVGDPLFEADPISATQLKAGVMYDLGSAMSFLGAIPVLGKVGEQAKVFGNFGNVQKVPILDNVIDDGDGTISTNPQNEVFVSFEVGLNLRSDDGTMAGKINYYNTSWNDRNLVKAVTTGQGSSGDTDIIFLSGVNQKHSGIEVEASAQLTDMFRLDGAASIGNWMFDGDASGNYKAYGEEGTVTTTYEYALDGLYVGDMPQQGLVLGGTVTPMPNLKVQALFNWYNRNFADWSPGDREMEDGSGDRYQVWEAPSYSKLDLHAFFEIPSTFDLGGSTVTMQAFVHVFNALDAVFVQDAVDNSQYNSWGGTGDHDADNAEVFLGHPRYFNVGLTFRF